MKKHTARKVIGKFQGFLITGSSRPAKTPRGRDRMWFHIYPPAGWRTVCVLSFGKKIDIRYEEAKLIKD